MITPGGSTTPERFARVRSVFEAALERPAAERIAYAAGACGGDDGLLREVEAMLRADGDVHRLLDEPSRPSSAPEEGRFPAGIVLAGRYRVLGLLGKGGMGEVYKAFDMILNQTVALKFLAPSNISQAALVRFRNEVRVARQVSHPNVCRVYDLGMTEGLHFLSMEYIDGEDLSSLLRRIGRLPQDKAIEFTRKICAGLEAAHERGVLHRDLKPSNIMIDGRGQVRITDFGLAALAAEIPLSDLRSGTPAYMSPEQKAGKDVTTRSDIYSLGLVLHEMFTGKRPQDSHATPSEIVKDLDPTIERLILRCLEEEPKRRPQSALNVAMALPGADPIAAALAAGETPSPEMVAASQEKEGFAVRTAFICCVAVVTLLIAGFWLSEKTGFLARAPLTIPPDALADRAQAFLKTVGYTEEPRNPEYRFFCCDEPAVQNLYRYTAPQREEILASHQPPIVAFFYRQLGAMQSGPPINPFPDGLDGSRRLEAGIRVILDAKGRLIRLEAPPSTDSTVHSPVDWRVLFSAAGLDMARFVPAPPRIIPPMAFDTRVAWTGTYADNRTESVRIEAASWQGRPVLFEIRSFAPEQGSFASFRPFRMVPVLVLVFGGVITAWRNLRLGRSDKRGAVVIVAAVLFMGLGGWAFDSALNFDPRSPFARLGPIGFFAALLSMFYIAVEPYARRNWPDSLISWTRLCGGRLRNALVASHVLAGIVAGTVALFAGQIMFESEIGIGNRLPGGAPGMGNGSQAVAQWIAASQLGLVVGLVFPLAVVLLRVLVRKVWLAEVLGIVPIVLIFAREGDGLAPSLVVVWWTAAWFVAMWLLRRFGLLTLIVMSLVWSVGAFFPLTITGWMAGRSIAYHLIPVVVAAWALWVISSEDRKRSTAFAN